MPYPLFATRPLGRSAPVVAMVGFLLGAILLLGVSVLFPMSPGAPVDEGKAAIGLGVVLAAATWWLAERLPRWVLLAEAVLIAVCHAGLTALAATPAGALADGMAFAVLAVYVGVFFPRSALWFSTFVVVLFGGALVLTGLPNLVAGGLVVALPTWAVGVGLGLVSGTIQRRAGTDPLTGALNRDGLDAVAARAFERARRRAEDLTVAVLDFDGFKQVNDSLGHAEGDRLLAEATLAWSNVLRSEDVVARMGGDEFVILLPGTSRDGAAPVLDRLRAAHPVRWTAGVAGWRPGESLAACVERADQRLYAAKATRSSRDLAPR